MDLNIESKKKGLKALECSIDISSLISTDGSRVQKIETEKRPKQQKFLSPCPQKVYF